MGISLCKTCRPTGIFLHGGAILLYALKVREGTPSLSISKNPDLIDLFPRFCQPFRGFIPIYECPKARKNGHEIEEMRLCLFTRVLLHFPRGS